MSRIAKYPVKVPAGVEIKINADQLTAKGGQGTLSMTIHSDVVVGQEDGQLTFAPSESAKSWAMAGTTRALVQNLVTGVSEGFTRTLEIVASVIVPKLRARRSIFHWASRTRSTMNCLKVSQRKRRRTPLSC